MYTLAARLLVACAAHHAYAGLLLQTGLEDFLVFLTSIIYTVVFPCQTASYTYSLVHMYTYLQGLAS